MWLLVFLAVTCHCGLAQNIIAYKKVDTSKGSIIGYTQSLLSDDNKLLQADIFLGIPYAKPPVGNLRFQRPQPVDPWTNPRNGSWPNQCPQQPASLPNPFGQKNDEDCLYLNIFSPNINAATKYPVMFYIHGGSFATGSVGEYEVDGAIKNLVSRGVVVVLIQYRLNVLGFFTANTTEFPANLGLLDQVEALKFVQQEIGAFGGDSNRTTIFGQSAGSCSVSAHTHSPLSQGLFQQAIMESGTALLCFDGTFANAYFSQTVAQQLCNFTASQWNSGNFTELKACMQNVPTDDFLKVKLQGLGELPWPMSVDGYFMPDFPRNLAAQRPAYYNNMPIMIGTTHDEWGFWETFQVDNGQPPLENFTRAYSQQEMAAILRLYGQQEPLVTDIINSVYVDPLNLNDSQNVDWLKVISRWHTDAAFAALAAREVDLWLNVNKNPNVYLYRYSYQSLIMQRISKFFNITGWNPVGHAEELYFLFMMPAIWNSNNTAITATDRLMADMLGKMWTDFAKTGNLTSWNWQAVTNDFSFNYMEITPTPVMRRDYGQTARTVFNMVIPKLTFLAPQIPPPVPTSPPQQTTTSPLQQTTTSAGSLTVVAGLVPVLMALLLAKM
uniref:Carboxylesterase type B domain-containing protein n=1 Tax=Plectus sambesii TaxID=2011161 RepID=A0A914UVD4_9BILA